MGHDSSAQGLQKLLVYQMQVWALKGKSTADVWFVVCMRKLKLLMFVRLLRHKVEMSYGNFKIKFGVCYLKHFCYKRVFDLSRFEHTLSSVLILLPNGFKHKGLPILLLSQTVPSKQRNPSDCEVLPPFHCFFHLPFMTQYRHTTTEDAQIHPLLPSLLEWGPFLLSDGSATYGSSPAQECARSSLLTLKDGCERWVHMHPELKDTYLKKKNVL